MNTALLLKYLRPDTRRVTALTALLLGGIGLQLVGPLAIRYFIDTALEGGELRGLYVAAVIFMSVGLGGQALTAVTTYVGRDVAWRATNRMRSDLLLHVLKLDMAFHTEHPPGELVERIDGDIERLANFFSKFAVRLLGGALLAVGVMVMLLLEDWRFGLAVAVFVATYLAVQLYGLKLTVALWRKNRQVKAELSGFIGERYPGVADIQKSGAEAHAMSGFRGTMQRWVSTHYRAIMTSIVAWMVSLVVLRMGNVLAIGVGGALFLSGTITVGTVFLIFQYLRLMTFPLMALSEELQDLQRSRASIDRIRGLFVQQPGVVGVSEEGTGGPMSVEFREVSFSYLPEHPVLNDVSFKVEPGRVLGVLGRTGSGKTTLSRLVFRQYDAGQGAVEVGGIDVKAMELVGLRGRVGMVTQDVQLFNAPLRENLAMFDRSIEDDRLIESLTALRLGPWYASLPDGLDTVLASGGDLLSAGEAQLVAFARVLLRGPDLVILDEASSRLDPATESLVERAVERLLEGRTAIVIAHRLATLERVDDVMIMDGGRVVENGPRQALASDPDSRYASLLRTGMKEVLA